MLALAAGGWAAQVLPGLGGALLSLAHEARDILRRAEAGVTDPLDTACFPLLPYANRIADGRFAFGGASHQVRRNFGDHPHALHGSGWQRPWRVVAAGAAHAHLALDAGADADWPWAYAAEQRLMLDESGLTATLRLVNRSDRPMPAGLGFHPYFVCGSATRLRFAADAVWLAGPTLLPVSSAPADHFGDWTDGAPVAGTTLIDNAYAGWPGRAEIGGDGPTIALTAEGAGWLHLFRPPGAGFFCAEPVTHMPDALNRAAPITVLAPGEATGITMRIALA